MKFYRRAYLCAAGLMAVLVLASCGKAPEKILLRYHLNKGDTYELSVMTDQDITQTVMGNEQKAKNKMGFVYTYKVMDVSKNGVATIKTTFKRITFNMKTPAQTIDYDSAKPGPAVSPMVAGFAGMVGQSFTIKMDDRGRIKAIEGTDAMIKSVMGMLSSVPASMQAGMRSALKKQFGGEALKESFGRMSDFMPAKPIAQGQTWRKKMVLTAAAPLIVNSSWTLKEHADGVALIDTTATMKPNPSASGMNMGNNMKVDYQLSGTGKGTIELDMASGFPKKSVFKQKTEGSIAISGPKVPEMSTPITIDATITMKSKKV